MKDEIVIKKLAKLEQEVNEIDKNINEINQQAQQLSGMLQDLAKNRMEKKGAIAVLKTVLQESQADETVKVEAEEKETHPGRAKK